MAQRRDASIPTIGEVIRAWREFRDLSSTDLAEKAGVRLGYLSEIEHNRTANPRQEYLEKLAAALDVSLLDIHGRRMPPTNSEAGTALGSKRSAMSTPTIAHPVISTPYFPLGTIGEEIERIIASKDLTEEEEEVLATALVEVTRQLLMLLETKRTSRRINDESPRRE